MPAVGPSLLVAPVLDKDATEVQVCMRCSCLIPDLACGIELHLLPLR